MSSDDSYSETPPLKTVDLNILKEMKSPTKVYHLSLSAKSDYEKENTPELNEDSIDVKPQEQTVSFLIDQMNTLKLSGETPMPKKNKFNLNAWSTPYNGKNSIHINNNYESSLITENNINNSDLSSDSDVSFNSCYETPPNDEKNSSPINLHIFHEIKGSESKETHFISSEVAHFNYISDLSKTCSYKCKPKISLQSNNNEMDYFNEENFKEESLIQKLMVNEEILKFEGQDFIIQALKNEKMLKKKVITSEGTNYIEILEPSSEHKQELLHNLPILINNEYPDTNNKSSYSIHSKFSENETYIPVNSTNVSINGDFPSIVNFDEASEENCEKLVNQPMLNNYDCIDIECKHSNSKIFVVDDTTFGLNKTFDNSTNFTTAVKTKDNVNINKEHLFVDTNLNSSEFKKNTEEPLNSKFPNCQKHKDHLKLNEECGEVEEVTLSDENWTFNFNNSIEMKSSESDSIFNHENIKCVDINLTMDDEQNTNISESHTNTDKTRVSIFEPGNESDATSITDHLISSGIIEKFSIEEIIDISSTIVSDEEISTTTNLPSLKITDEIEKNTLNIKQHTESSEINLRYLETKNELDEYLPMEFKKTVVISPSKTVEKNVKCFELQDCEIISENSEHTMSIQLDLPIDEKLENISEQSVKPIPSAFDITPIVGSISKTAEEVTEIFESQESEKTLKNCEQNISQLDLQIDEKLESLSELSAKPIPSAFDIASVVQSISETAEEVTEIFESQESEKTLKNCEQNISQLDLQINEKLESLSEKNAKPIPSALDITPVEGSISKTAEEVTEIFESQESEKTLKDCEQNISQLDLQIDEKLESLSKLSAKPIPSAFDITSVVQSISETAEEVTEIFESQESEKTLKNCEQNMSQLDLQIDEKLESLSEQSAKPIPSALDITPVVGSISKTAEEVTEVCASQKFEQIGDNQSNLQINEKVENISEQQATNLPDSLNLPIVLPYFPKTLVKKEKLFTTQESEFIPENDEQTNNNLADLHINKNLENILEYKTVPTILNLTSVLPFVSEIAEETMEVCTLQQTEETLKCCGQIVNNQSNLQVISEKFTNLLESETTAKLTTPNPLSLTKITEFFMPQENKELDNKQIVISQLDSERNEKLKNISEQHKSTNLSEPLNLPSILSSSSNTVDKIDFSIIQESEIISENSKLPMSNLSDLQTDEKPENTFEHKTIPNILNLTSIVPTASKTTQEVEVSTSQESWKTGENDEQSDLQINKKFENIPEHETVTVFDPFKITSVLPSSLKTVGTSLENEIIIEEKLKITPVKFLNIVTNTTDNLVPVKLTDKNLPKKFDNPLRFHSPSLSVLDTIQEDNNDTNHTSLAKEEISNTTINLRDELSDEISNVVLNEEALSESYKSPERYFFSPFTAKNDVELLINSNKRRHKFGSIQGRVPNLLDLSISTLENGISQYCTTVETPAKSFSKIIVKKPFDNENTYSKTKQSEKIDDSENEIKKENDKLKQENNFLNNNSDFLKKEFEIHNNKVVAITEVNEELLKEITELLKKNNDLNEQLNEARKIAAVNEDLLKENAELLKKNNELNEKLKQKEEDFIKVHQEVAKVLKNETNLKKTLVEYEDVVRLVTNKYEMLKEYSDKLLIECYEEQEKLKKKYVK